MEPTEAAGRLFLSATPVSFTPWTETDKDPDRLRSVLLIKWYEVMSNGGWPSYLLGAASVADVPSKQADAGGGH